MTEQIFKILGVTLSIVFVGVILKDYNAVTSIMGSYNNILGTLEKAG